MRASAVDEEMIKKNILSLIIPITAENVLQIAAGLISMAMVSRVSTVGVGAIGISIILIRIIWAILKGVATGNSVFVAQSFGSDNFNKLWNSTMQAFVIIFITSILFQQLIYWNAEFLISIYNPPHELLEAGIVFLKLISYSLPFTGIMLLVAGVLQGMGITKIPMVIVAILNIVNIFFSYALIFGKFGMPALGLRGAAISYNIAFGFASCLSLYSLFHKNSMFQEIKYYTDQKFTMKGSIDLIRFAIPSSLEMCFWQITSIIITRAVLTYGETADVAYQLGLQAESISFIPAASLGLASSLFIRETISANDRELGKSYFKHLLKATLIVTSFASAFLILFPNIIMKALSPDLEVISIGVIYIFVMGLVQIPKNVTGIINGALSGAGYTKSGLINSGVGLWLVRVPLILIITYVFNADLHWIWIAIGFDLIVRFIFAVIVFREKAIFSKTHVVYENIEADINRS